VFEPVAGDDGAIDGANRRTDNPVGLDIGFMQRLINAALISAERATALKSKDDLAPASQGRICSSCRLSVR
jgi:hypothetical protein